MSTDDRPAHLTRGNPFIAISNPARLAIVIYFVLWRIVPELPAALQLETPARDVVVARAFARVGLETLLLLPFLLNRFGGMPIGWLHPLVLPGLLTIAKDIVTNPYTLLAAVTAWQTAPVIPEYRLMADMPLEVLLAAELKRDALAIVAQSALLLGFAAWSRRARPVMHERTPGVSPLRLMLVVGICFATFLVFVHMNGGAVAHFSRLAYGRFLMGQSAGHFLVVIAVLPYVLALWYVARPRVLRQPWFIALLAAALVVQFATTASRSSLIGPMILMLAAWMVINRRPPGLRLAALGAFVVVFLGLLGDLRSSALRNDGVVDFSVLTETGLLTAVQRTMEHRARNAEVSGQIAVMHAVPDTVAHLHGRTYLAAIAFFIPRTIWPDKPRGPGAHVGAIINSGMSGTQGYTSAAYPPGGVGEAYWNFGVTGVAGVYLLFGVFLKLVAHRFVQRPRHPFRVMVFLMAMLSLGTPSSDHIVSFLQDIVLLAATWLFVRQPARSVAVMRSAPAMAHVR